MSQPDADPYFFTPRQLAEHLLLTYPPDYKVSPAQLKHSVILANDVSGKVFMCAISGPGELEVILGVGTLGARVWLWDEIRRMRRMSVGYRCWERQREAEDREEQRRARDGDGDGDGGVGFGMITSYLTPPVGDTKRKRDVGNSPAEHNAKRHQAPASRWAAVRTAPSPSPSPASSPAPPPAPASIPDGSIASSLSSEIFVPRLEDEGASFAPSSQRVSTISPTVETDIPDSDSETSCTPRPRGHSRKHGDRLTVTPRPLRPRSYNQQNLPTLELVHILDPENLDISEINIILRAIREIPAGDIYGEVIRAARVTAGDIDGRLSPSTLAIKEGKEIVDFVREIAAVYASWILSKPYPPKSLEPGDVEKMASFESFLQFEVQLLNLLIPYESRRRSTSYHTATPASASTPNSTQTSISTPTPTSTWTSTPTPASHQTKSGLVVSDLSPPPPTEHDRCPEGWSLKQRKWGEAVVKRYQGTHKSWINLKPKPKPKPKPTK